MVDNCAGDRARGSWLTLFMKEKGYEGYEDQRDFKEEGAGLLTVQRCG